MADDLLEQVTLAGTDVKHPVTRSYELTATQIKRIQTRAVRSFYLRPSYVTRTLRSIDSPIKLWNYARRGLSVIANP